MSSYQFVHLAFYFELFTSCNDHGSPGFFVEINNLQDKCIYLYLDTHSGYENKQFKKFDDCGRSTKVVWAKFSNLGENNQRYQLCSNHRQI